MAKILAARIVREHGEALMRLERGEIRSLSRLYEEARLELLGRLSEVRAHTFTAQQYRGALAQTESGLRSIILRLDEQIEGVTATALEQSVDQVMRQIAHYEPTFTNAVSAVQLDALRRVSVEKGLLLQKSKTSTARYGLDVVGDVQRRLGVHLIKKSSWRDMSLDVAGRLDANAIAGAKWKAERIVRTEMWDALSAGHQAAIEAAAETIPDLFRQWDSTLDARTSPGCRELEGQVRRIDEPFSWSGGTPMRPPRHPNCRSRLLPWTPRWALEELKEGRAEDAKEKKAADAKKTPDQLRRSKIESAEAAIRTNSAFETALIFNDEGETILSKRGEARSVSLNRRERNLMRGKVFSHNHPSGGSFSPDDIKVAAYAGVREMRAVGSKYTYSMRAPKGREWTERFWEDEIEPGYKRADLDVFTRLSAAIRAGDMTEDLANLTHWHEVWKQVAEGTGLRYSRTLAPK